MTNEQLKKLENDLWASANSLRAYGGIKAADYAVPVLGLIFLRFCENKYSQYEAEILTEFQTTQHTRLERPLEAVALSKCGFYLPDYARYQYLLDLPGDQSMAKALQKAMEGIEEHQDEKFKNVLPKEAYFEIEKKKVDILPQLLKTFSDIPKDATGDVFGKIYEYFLGEFAMSEGQKGGEFFTPTSVVRFIVEVIEPFAGKIYDPACGSGGMFVQSAKFIQETKHDLNDIYVYGQEYMGETARLAKMNLMVNNIRGEITETNSYENDPYNSLSKFDFVMANPPFNVKSVKESTVKNDPRFYQFGLPKNKGKNTDDSITDANYLWVSLFATSLNDRGRAGFVMPNSASDAGNSEYDIRKRIVDSGIVDCMVSMPSNMFFTVTLPATLWFFDKQKAHSDRKDSILFLDARNVYTQIDRAHREWKEEQIQNLAAIVRLYRGETDRYLALIQHYIAEAYRAFNEVVTRFEAVQLKMNDGISSLEQHLKLPSRIATFTQALPTLDTQNAPLTNTDQVAVAQTIGDFVTQLKAIDQTLKDHKERLLTVWTEADKTLKLKTTDAATRKNWAALGLNLLPKGIDELYQHWKTATDTLTCWHSSMDWLQSRFPEAKYVDVVGLCKAADKTEYAEEQDYSLNAGRYVGVEIEGGEISKEAYINSLTSKRNLLVELNSKSFNLTNKIEQQLTLLINELG